jgi:hypothetical protein
MAFTTGATGASNVGSYAVDGGGLTADNGNYVFVQAAGNASVLTVRPATLTISVNSAGMTYGGPLPTFGATVNGLVNGQTLASVTGGAIEFATNAGSTSNVGSYAVTDSGLNLTSPNYVLAQASNNAIALTISPATLTYTADAAAAVAGKTIAGLGGSVTGFVGGQTLASATTGTASWTTPANTASPAGRYAIDGAGLSADDGNYDFIQASGNATALTINAPAGAARAAGTPPGVDNAVASALVSVPDATPAAEATQVAEATPAAEATTTQSNAGFGIASVATVVDVVPLAGLPLDAPLVFASAPDADGPTQVVSLSQAQAILQGAQGNPQGAAPGAGGPTPDQGSGSAQGKDVRVPASRNSLAAIVNGGVRLPSGVEQQLFVVRGN